MLNLDRSTAGILHISLNRPDALNALNEELLARLYDVFWQAKMDPNIKALLITGDGKGFCAGADINQLEHLNAHNGREFALHGQTIFRLLEQLGKPSLAAIHGFALGGGCELAMSATIRIAASNAMFGQPEIKLGVIPGFGGTQRLARLIGKGRAMDLCLTGRKLSAVDALNWGLVTELVPPEKLLERAHEILQKILALPPLAIQSVMTVIDTGYDLALTEALELEAAHFGLCCATKDKQEGVKAFIEKRPAFFAGE
jgi:enoyl-CoA hydratase